MEEPGEAVTTSKEGEGVNRKEKGEEGGWVEGRKMQTVLGEEGSGGGKEGVGHRGERRAVDKSIKGIPMRGRWGQRVQERCY